MLRELASVVRHDGPALVLKTERQGTCARCSLKGGCGQYLLARDRGLLEMQDCDLAGQWQKGALQPGEQVEVSLSGGQLLCLAGLFYGVPLLGLLLAALLAALLGAGEGVLMLATVVGLAGGVLLSRLLLNRDSIRSAASPRILRSASAASGAAAALADGSQK